MPKARVWIKAMRLRTLPLALASIIMGGCLAFYRESFDPEVTLLAALTTLLLQVLSNFANDYGDTVNGIDNAGRVGPLRTVQSGMITPGQMKKAMILVSVLSFISGTLLVYLGTKGLPPVVPLAFIGAGLLAIAAAILYTVGKRPYGYIGMGDFFVFVFFGIAGVMGTYFLNTGSFDPEVLLPAASMGFLSSGVLNMNNLRDIENDRRSGKMTLVVRLGFSKARYYHLGLIIAAIACGLIFTLMNYHSPVQFLFVIAVPFLWMNTASVFTIKAPEQLDAYLKKLAVASLLFSVSFGLGLVI